MSLFAFLHQELDEKNQEMSGNNCHPLTKVYLFFIFFYLFLIKETKYEPSVSQMDEQIQCALFLYNHLMWLAM